MQIVKMMWNPSGASLPIRLGLCTCVALFSFLMTHNVIYDWKIYRYLYIPALDVK